MVRCTLRRSLATFGIVVAFYLILRDIYIFGGLSCPQVKRISSPRKDQSSVKIFSPSIEELTEVVGIGKGLNKHCWQNNCLTSIEQLCNFPIFPNAPDNRSFIATTNLTLPSNADVVMDGCRLFGYLRPRISGEHYFAVSSNGFAEVWLSPSKNWRAAKRVANTIDQTKPLEETDFVNLNSQISDGIYLEVARRYYFELIYAAGVTPENEAKFAQVAWKRPGDSGFRIIDENVLSPYFDDVGMAKLKIYDENIPDIQRCVKLTEKHDRDARFEAGKPRLHIKAVNKALSHCDYEPSYVINPSIKLSEYKWRKYEGVRKYTLKTFSYPLTVVDGITRHPTAKPKFYAEHPLDVKEAYSVVEEYAGAIETAYPRKYRVEATHRVEKKDDPRKGSRYLLNVDIKDLKSGTIYNLEEYVYHPRGQNSLCYPKGLQWDRTADVYLILTSKNLGRWVHHFIKNVELIVRETNDQHVHVIIYDFDSPNIDLKKVLSESSLKNYHFITKAGNYSRTLSLTEAVKSVPDPHGIIVTVDLHLDIGSQFIAEVRKRCVKGRTVFAPEIISLSCGASSSRPHGYWYHYSYGTIAMYKVDWDRFGGFSDQTFAWGGEDWDIIDFVVKQGLEVERMRTPWVYHYYHDKHGMWSGNYKKKN